MPRQTATERVAEQFRRAADDAAEITHPRPSVIEPTSDSATHPRFTGSTRTSHPAEQEIFALMPVPLDHDDREQDILTADTPHELNANHPGWAHEDTP
jgi:hypothetical protein